MPTNKQNKIILATTLASLINIKLFLLFSNFSQIWMMYKYSESFTNLTTVLFKYYYTFLETIPTITLCLYILFSITIFFFWFTYFRVYFNRLPDSKIHGGSKYKILANVFTFLGFGCVACGQTLLYSMLLLFGSQTLLFLGDYIGNIVMIFGIILLFFGIRENNRLYRDRNICKI